MAKPEGDHMVGVIQGGLRNPVINVFFLTKINGRSLKCNFPGDMKSLKKGLFLTTFITGRLGPHLVDFRSILIPQGFCCENLDLYFYVISTWGQPVAA